MKSAIRKLRFIFGGQEVLLLTGLLAAILLMSLLQVAGIATVFPFLTLASDPLAIDDHSSLQWIYEQLGFTSEFSFLFWIGCAVLLLLAVSNICFAWTTWAREKYAWSMAHRCSMRLVRKYSELPYQFYLSHNSAELIRKLTDDVNRVITGVLIAGIELVTHGVICALVFVLLLAIHAQLAIGAMVVFGGSYAGIYFAQQAYVTRLGRDRLETNLGRYRTFFEVLTGIKSIKSDGVQEYFIKRFEVVSERYAGVHPQFVVVSQLPKFLIEMLALGGLVAVVLYLLATNRDLTSSLPVAGVFAIAAYRLLPSVNRVYAAAIQLRHNLAVVDELYGDLAVGGVSCGATPAPVVEHFSMSDQLTVEHVTFHYDGSPRAILNDVCLNIAQGEKVAFVGTTGSGKTTLLDVVVGLLTPDEGYLAVDGVNVTPANMRAWQRVIGYVPQDVFLYDDTVARNIAFGIDGADIDMPRIRKSARLAQIDEFIRTDLPQGYDTEVGERGVRLSGGQKQRLGLARAFYRRPQVLLLDEATSALDGITEEAVLRALFDEQIELTVLMVAHRLSTVRLCSRICLMEQGRVVQIGSYDELCSKSERFRQMVELTALSRDEPS